MKNSLPGKLLIIVFILSLFIPGSSRGQANQELVLNQALDNATRSGIEVRAKAAAEDFINTVIKGDLESANQYFPSKSVYREMIEGFGFKTEDGKIAALENLEVHYLYEKERVHHNFSELRQSFSQKGELRITNVIFSFKENVALRGGRAAVVLEQVSTGNTFAVYLYKFYEHNNKWYITNKVRTDS